MNNKPIILAITGASGTILGMKILEFLLKGDYRVELIISQSAYYVAKQELGLELVHDSKQIKDNILSYIGIQEKCDYLKVWMNDELWANPSSGSYDIAGMMIVPASMSTVASIAHGLSDKLITRVADVAIKQGRKLVIVPRETPFSSIHLDNMLKLSNLGVKIVPPIIGFYGGVQSLDEGLNFIIGKILDVFGIENVLYKRWSYE